MPPETQFGGVGAARFDDAAPARFTLEAMALATRDGCVLLELEGRTRRWCLPSSPVDGPETAAEVLCLSVSQTLGVDARAVALLGLCHCPTARHLSLVFEVSLRALAHPAPLTDDLLHAAWFRAADLPADLHARSRLVVQAALGDGPVPFILTHKDDLGIVEPPGLRLPGLPLGERPQ